MYASFLIPQPRPELKNVPDTNPEPAGVRWRFRGSCQIVNEKREEDGGLINVECQVSDRSLNKHFDLLGKLSIRGETVVPSELVNRWLVGDGITFNNVYYEGGPVSIDGEHWKVDLRFKADDSRLNVWLPGGAAVESVVIRWPRDQGAQTPLPPLSRFSGEAVMTLRPGYGRISAAIARMVERAEAHEIDVFDGSVFRGGPVIQALLREMDISSTAWCCDEWSDIPALMTTRSLASTTAVGPRARFNQYCADCHALPNVSPSSFLSGTDEEVEQKLSECAERIFYRLGMWDTDKQHREKTPMPPMLHIVQLESMITTDQIRADLKHMRDYVASLLEGDTAHIMTNGYENTESCGPFQVHETLGQ